MTQEPGSWWASRSGLPEFAQRGAEMRIPGGASWVQVLHSVIPLFIILQFITGALLLLKYQATPEGAWNSVSAIRALPFGAFISSLHHWGVSFLVVLSALQVLAVLLIGGYRPPRELTWWTLLLLSGLLIAMAMTGQALPWDQKGYWGTVVILTAVQEMPLLGAPLAGLLKGGAEFGAHTLSAFVALHSVIIPALLLITLCVYRSSLRRVGPAAPWWRPEDTSDSFSPSQYFRDALVFFLLVGALFLLALFLPAHAEPQADPLDASYTPRPEWYFTWIFYGVRFAPGNLSLLFEAGAPLLLLLVFATLPFLDRRGPRPPWARWPVLIAPLLVFLAIGLLTIAGLLETPAPAAPVASPQAAAAIPPLNEKDHAWARRAFRGNCADCHGLEGQGDGAYLANLPEAKAKIPVFSQKFFAPMTEEGLIQVVSNGLPPGVEKQLMPGYASMYKPEQIRLLVDFVLTEFGGR